MPFLLSNYVSCKRLNTVYQGIRYTPSSLSLAVCTLSLLFSFNPLTWWFIRSTVSNASATQQWYSCGGGNAKCCKSACVIQPLPLPSHSRHGELPWHFALWAANGKGEGPSYTGTQASVTLSILSPYRSATAPQAWTQGWLCLVLLPYEKGREECKKKHEQKNCEGS